MLARHPQPRLLLLQSKQKRRSTRRRRCAIAHINKALKKLEYQIPKATSEILPKEVITIPKRYSWETKRKIRSIPHIASRGINKYLKDVYGHVVLLYNKPDEYQVPRSRELYLIKSALSVFWLNRQYLCSCTTALLRDCMFWWGCYCRAISASKTGSIFTNLSYSCVSPSTVHCTEYSY